jgi:hypothetical protein
VFSAAVTVTDPSAPTISAPSGPLWTAGFQQGRQSSASFGGSDNTGIFEAAWWASFAKGRTS